MISRLKQWKLAHWTSTIPCENHQFNLVAFPPPPKKSFVFIFYRRQAAIIQIQSVQPRSILQALNYISRSFFLSFFIRAPTAAAPSCLLARIHFYPSFHVLNWFMAC